MIRILKHDFFLPITIVMVMVATPMLAEEGPIYTIKNAKEASFRKEIYKVPGKLGTEVFPVLVDNAIGTTYNNSISLIRFKNGRFKTDVLKKDFSDYVEGVSGFLPIFSDQYMGYIQTRRFLLFNLQEATYRYYTICDTINEHLIDVDIIDFEKKQFVFLLDNTSRKNGKKSQEIALKIIELKEESAKTLRTLILTKEGKLILSWESFFNQLFFFYNRETNQYLVMDSNFQPTSHPLISILNEYRDVKNTYPDTVFKIHPKLPFAVIKGKTKMWVASWKDSKISLTPIIYRPEFSYKISISPDGKWFMLSKTVKLNSSGRSVKAYYAMPVDENIPYYLGDPISLGIDEEPDDVLWTVNPTSLVAVNQFSHITRWVLEGQ